MQRALNITWILLICVILMTATIYQYAMNQHPCPLCWIQRLSMVGIAICALMNLKFGVRPLHYGLSLLFSLLSHHLSMRLVPLGSPLFGYTLTTWSSFVFSGSLLGAAVLLILYKEEPPKWAIPEKIMFSLLVSVIIVSTYISAWPLKV